MSGGTSPRPRQSVNPPGGGDVGTGMFSRQGMISADDFVFPEGNLTPLAFRFLHSLFTAVVQLQTQVATLQATVTTLQARLP